MQAIFCNNWLMNQAILYAINFQERKRKARSTKTFEKAKVFVNR